MILSRKHNSLFIEIPHTASTAISAELCAHYDGEPILHKHANWTEFRAAFPRDFVKKLFVFAGVRNPLDAAVTDYAKFKSNHHGSYTRPEKHRSNGGWVPEIHLEKFRYVTEKNATFPEFFGRFYNDVQHNWFLVGSSRYDFVIRYESLQEHFAACLKTIGIEPLRPLPVVNKTARAEGFADAYDEAARAQAVRVFGPIMRAWGYSFPKSWEVGSIPFASRIKYRLLEAPVGLAAKFMTLSPGSSRIRAMKNALRRVVG